MKLCLKYSRLFFSGHGVELEIFNALLNIDHETSCTVFCRYPLYEIDLLYNDAIISAYCSVDVLLLLVMDVAKRSHWGDHPFSRLLNNVCYITLFCTISDGQKLTKKLPTKSLTNFLVRPIV